MIKIIAALVVSLCASLYGLYWQVQESGKLKAEISQYEQLVKAKDALIAKERKNAAEVALRAQKFYEDKQNDQKELDDLRNCVANKSCGVRVVRGACPAMPGTNSTARGTEAADAADRRQFEQDYIGLVASIKETKRRYDWMQAELIARSAPDYCQP
jgi:hypothetical protein